MDSPKPEVSARNAVDAIADGNRAAAVDAINQMLYGKSAETLDGYADTLAKSYFGTMELPDGPNDTPVAEPPTAETPETTTEPEPNETDNGANWVC